MRRRILSPGVVLLVGVFSACSPGTEGEQVDPNVSRKGAVQWGIMRTDGFAPLLTHGELDVVLGIQGGRWAMPAALFTNVQAGGELSVSLKSSDGVILGEQSRNLRLGAESVSGERLMPVVPVPVRKDEIAIFDLDGDLATLGLRFISDVDDVESDVSVILKIVPVAE